MINFLTYGRLINKFINLTENEGMKTFMFAKNFIGIDFNFCGEPMFVCKLPSHIIRSQSENPAFEVYGSYNNDKLIALMIKVEDLTNSPYIVVSNFGPPLTLGSIELDIKTLSFINEVNEPILSVKVDERVKVPQFKSSEFESLLAKEDLLRLLKEKGCRYLCKALLTQDVAHFVSRDTDQHFCLHNLSSEVSKNGEDAVHGHGKRLEDMIHFQAASLVGAKAQCGIKYAMSPIKGKTPSEELCDELITYGETAIFIQEKSIITKPRFRDTETLSDRIETTIKRIKQAAVQLCKHIRSVKEQNYSIYTEAGKTALPNSIIGVIVVSETFNGNV